MKKREYRIDAAEKVELYKAFYQKMAVRNWQPYPLPSILALRSSL